jgi:hypothetical protein
MINDTLTEFTFEEMKRLLRLEESAPFVSDEKEIHY